MIFGLKRSVFLVLLSLTLLVGVTFGVIIFSTIRANRSVSAPEPTDHTVSTQAAARTESVQPVVEATTITLGGTATVAPPVSSATDPATAIITSTPTQLTTQSPAATPLATSTVTLTPDIDICALMSIDYVKTTSTIVLWRVRNDSSQSTRLTHIALTWPKQNDAVFNAILDGEVIWAGAELVSPTIMTTWRGEPTDRDIFDIHALEFFFGTPASDSGYNLQISFSNGCTIAISN